MIPYRSEALTPCAGSGDLQVAYCSHSTDNINIYLKLSPLLSSGNGLIMITPLSIDAQGCKIINVFSRRNLFKNVINIGFSNGI